MKIALAQINTTVGDIAGNYQKILNAYNYAAQKGADVVLTPELALTGYPPQDLLYKTRFVPLNLDFLDRLNSQVRTAALVTGFVDFNTTAGRPFRNAAALMQKGKPIEKAYKTLLPTYDVFDEDRYFEPGTGTTPFSLSGSAVGLTICEDIWTEKYLPRKLYGSDPVAQLARKGLKSLLNISASPFHLGKPKNRHEMLSVQAAKHNCSLFYCNAVGGNDQLIFDGNSLAFNSRGELIAQLPAFEECLRIVDTEAGGINAQFPCDEQDLFNALCLGLRDYLSKCGFKSVVLGLSGGIDSAVSAAIAVAALGPENVLGVSMPTRFSSPGSIDDALCLARNLDIRCLQIPIERTFNVFREQFSEIFKGLPEDTTEENMQPRLRAMTLMALSNKFNHLLLTTGNKSELAVGYCTIYGDMAGGMALISDVPKTVIYNLARWINRDLEIIPRSTLEKPPSAELRPNQTDQDTLPPYDVLDNILQLYIEENLSTPDIVAKGFEESTVRWVARRVDLNEYKREQAAPGLKVTSRAFGIGRRMPVAQRFID